MSCADLAQRRKSSDLPFSRHLSGTPSSHFSILRVQFARDDGLAQIAHDSPLTFPVSLLSFAIGKSSTDKTGARAQNLDPRPPACFGLS